MRHASIRSELLLDTNRAPWNDATTTTRAAAFEAEIAERLGAQHAIAVASPTTAFQIAYRAVGVPLGATVLTSSLADPTVVRATVGGGLRPRFADVDARGHLAGPAVAAHAAIHGEPAVLVPSHFAGHPYDSRALAAAVPRALVIEDAIDALGAVHADGCPVGRPTHAALVVLGVRPAGAMAPAQGALVVTDDRTLAARLRQLRDERAEHRLSELHAALGLVHLGRLPGLVTLRARIAARYDAAAATLALAEPVRPAPDARSAWAAYPLRVPAWLRPAVALQLQTWGIGGRRLATLLHRHPYFGRYADVLPAELPVTERFASEVVLLPTTAYEDAYVARVTDLLAATVAGGVERARLAG